MAEAVHDEGTEIASTSLIPHKDEADERGERVEIYINAEGKKVKRIIRKKKRPARVQVDPSTLTSEPPPQTGTIFNIWYNKWSGGDREDKYLSKTHAKGRCSIAKDSGFTRADGVPGSYFCLFFARGVCPRGRDCEYLHRLPSTFDIYSGNVDCFGREKHSDYRDDMGGVGTFNRQNRTLYIGKIHPSDDIEEVVARHFTEWGPIERIRVLPGRAFGFVTYATEALAQFAKEAMAHQSLDHDEILNVRWATPDQNPVSQKREARAIELQAAEAIRQALPAEFVKQIEGERGVKRRRFADGDSEDRLRQNDPVHVHTALEAPDDRLLLPDIPNEEEGLDSQLAPFAKAGNGGLFNTSTLAALNKYKPGGATAQAKKESDGKDSKAMLVGYGSDDEDSE